MTRTDITHTDHRRAPGSRQLMSEKSDILKIVLAVLLPPLGVFFEVGLGKHFWINVLLTILGWIPGIIHAIWVISRY